MAAPKPRTVRAPDLKPGPLGAPFAWCVRAVLNVQFKSKKRQEGRVRCAETLHFESRFRWFDKEKGFGKILWGFDISRSLPRPLDAKIGSPEEEIFVHKNQIEDGTEGENYAALAQGVKWLGKALESPSQALVSYEMTTREDGKPCAGNVRVQGFAKILQNGLTQAAGAALSAKEAKLRQLLLNGLQTGHTMLADEHAMLSGNLYVRIHNCNYVYSIVYVLVKGSICMYLTSSKAVCQGCSRKRATKRLGHLEFC